MAMAFVNRYYMQSRGLESGIDDRTDPRDILSVALQKVLDLLRGALRGYPGTYMSPSVRIRGRRHMRIGRDVAIARNVSINALSVSGIQLGNKVTIDESAILRATGVVRNLGNGIEIGDRTSIGAFNTLLGQGGISIGENCLLAPYVTVVSENHAYADTSRAIREQGEIRKPVKIGNDVWIGSGATILSGVCVGDGAVVAAGAVVTSDVDPFSIVGGVPAKRLGTRGEES